MRREVDLWSRWWNRLSQIAGLAIVGYEVVLRPGGAERFAMLFAAAMMLGPAGLRLMLRGISDLTGDAAQKLKEKEHDER